MSDDDKLDFPCFVTFECEVCGSKGAGILDLELNGEINVVLNILREDRACDHSGDDRDVRTVDRGTALFTELLSLLRQCQVAAYEKYDGYTNFLAKLDDREAD